jgi:hypothetical protein
MPTAFRKFREDGYEIVYLDETWVNQNHATDYMWLPVDGEQGFFELRDRVGWQFYQF